MSSRIFVDITCIAERIPASETYSWFSRWLSINVNRPLRWGTFILPLSADLYRALIFVLFVRKRYEKRGTGLRKRCKGIFSDGSSQLL